MITNAKEQMDSQGLDESGREQVWKSQYEPMIHARIKALFPDAPLVPGSWKDTELAVDRAKTSMGEMSKSYANRQGEMRAGLMNPQTGTIVKATDQGGFQSIVPEVSTPTTGTPAQGVPAIAGGKSSPRYPGAQPVQNYAPNSPADIANQKLEMEAAHNANQKSYQNFEKDTKLQQMHEKIGSDFREQVKEYESVKDAVSGIRALKTELKPDAGGNINVTAGTALATKIAKLLDPTTGVKEAELRNILAGNQGVLERIMSMKQRFINGSMSLTQDQIKQLTGVAEALDEALHDRYNERAEPFKQKIAGLKAKFGGEYKTEDFIPRYRQAKDANDLAEQLKTHQITPQRFIKMRKEYGW
jgi:hypothetical protein